MITTDRDGREVEFDVSGEEDDVYIDSMVYTDTGEEADDLTVLWVEEHKPDKVFEAWFERQIVKAERWKDGLF